MEENLVSCDALREKAFRRTVLMALQSVIDPEVGLNIVDMGLVYGIEITNDDVRVRLTLTTKGCPMGTSILDETQESLAAVSGERKVVVEMVWFPPWSPAMISPAARRGL